MKNSNIIYELKCRCDARHVGRTTQTLTDGIKQHVLLSIRKNTIGTRTQPVRACGKIPASIPTSCTSAVGRHLIENANCAEHYNMDAIKILIRGRSINTSPKTRRDIYLFHGPHVMSAKRVCPLALLICENKKRNTNSSHDHRW